MMGRHNTTVQLLVDIGNTCIKWAFWTSGDPLHALAATHRGNNLEILLTELWGKAAYPKKVLVSNVAGAAIANTLKKWIQDHWHVPVRFLASTKKQGGIQNGYQNPQALGVDRWLAMIGARYHASGPLCVIDCGTAMTIDAVTSKGEHLGGLILPGLSRLQTALLDDCPHLLLPTAVSPSTTETFLAKNTEGAITVGALFMVTATIERVLEELSHQFGTPFTPMITGGDAPQLLAYLPEDCQHRPDLVLEGMCALTD